MVLRWRELRARESSAIMIIEIFIAFIQAIIIFDYSETPPPLTANSAIRSPRYYGRFFLASWQNGHTFSCTKKKKTSFGRIYGHLLIRPNFFGPLMTILTGFHCIIF